MAQPFSFFLCVILIMLLLRANINMSAPIMSRFDLFFVILDDGVIGDAGDICFGWSGTLEECWAVDEHPPFDGVVFLDDFRVDIGDEE